MATRNPKNFEFRLGKQGLLLFVAGMSILLVMVFIFGVAVGVHIDAYPERIARSLPEMIRGQLPHREIVTGNMAMAREEVKVPPPAEENKAASLPDVKDKKEELSRAASGTVAVKESPKQASGAAEKTIPAAMPPAGPENKVGLSKNPPLTGEEKVALKPAATGAEEKKSSALAPPPVSKSDTEAPATGGKFLIQVGSFKSRTKARELCNKIETLGFKPRLAMSEVPNKGKWFRVTIGGFSSREEAKKATAVLARKIKGVTGMVRPVK